MMRADRGALLTYLCILAYASLNPFFGWRWPEAFTLFASPRYVIAFDVLINIAAYAPLGAMLASVLRQRSHYGSLKLASSVKIWCSTVAACAAVSLGFELLQAFLPGRVSSAIDLFANTFGAALGAALVLAAPGRLLIATWRHWRHRHFSPGDMTGWGLILLALWVFAQLNPAIPFFEAGNIANPLNAGSAHAYDPPVLLPQAACIMFNVCGFVLFVALLMPPKPAVMLNILMLLAGGLVLKIAMAAMMLKAPQMIDWMAPARVIGLTSGLILAAYFVRLRFRWRAFCATLFVFAGGLMAKITSSYGAFDETLRLFYWPHGQLVNFASLTRWINEIWPLLAVLFLASLFVTRHEPH
ncbi:MAG: VanZ family protein [Betaproteobacteria bacterium]